FARRTHDVPVVVNWMPNHFCPFGVDRIEAHGTLYPEATPILSFWIVWRDLSERPPGYRRHGRCGELMVPPAQRHGKESHGSARPGVGPSGRTRKGPLPPVPRLLRPGREKTALVAPP